MILQAHFSLDLSRGSGFLINSIISLSSVFLIISYCIVVSINLLAIKYSSIYFWLFLQINLPIIQIFVKAHFIIVAISCIIVLKNFIFYQ